MNGHNKVNIYLVSNLCAWLLLSLVMMMAIFHFIGAWILRLILTTVLCIGLAFFEEKILSRIINRIVALFCMIKSDLS